MSAKQSVSALEDHLGYWLRILSNHVSHSFRRRVEAQGVTVAEWVVLRTLLSSAPINPSQLAEIVGLTRGSVSKLIDRLVDKNLVRCRSEKKDRRYQTLTLTPMGRKLVPLLAQLADDNDAEVFGHLRSEKHKSLFGALKNIVRHHGLKDIPVD
jgi:DNA-binding MarR family transcriptional regulator